MINFVKYELSILNISWSKQKKINNKKVNLKVSV